MIEYVEEQELDPVDAEELPEGVRLFTINRRYQVMVGAGTQDGKPFLNIMINPPPRERALPVEIWKYFKNDPRQGDPTGMLNEAGTALSLWTEGMKPSG